ncbi:MAG: hypothetical protein M5U28_27280, partial [Sandaracinaceae bacterium]|nr:hypothetical protein [Sandaracinaceae bacterium]
CSAARPQGGGAGRRDRARRRRRPDNVELARVVLARRGYHVLTAADGVEALAILEQSRPGDWDALVIDTVDVQRVARLGHLAALTPDDYPWGDIFPELRDEVLHYVDGKLYGVPEKFGYNTVAYDAKAGHPVDVAYQEPTQRRLPQNHY